MALLPQDYRKTAQTHRYGLYSARPDASTALVGTLYFAYDIKVLYRSNGTSWDIYSGLSNSDLNNLIELNLSLQADILRRVLFIEQALGIDINTDDLRDLISDSELIELNGGQNGS